MTDANGCHSVSGSGALTINPTPAWPYLGTVFANALPATVTASGGRHETCNSYVWTVPSGLNPDNCARFTTSIARSGRCGDHLCQWLHSLRLRHPDSQPGADCGGRVEPNGLRGRARGGAWWQSDR